MLIHMDGFDSYANNSDLGFQYGGGASVSTTGGRFGQGALYIGNYNQWILKTFNAPVTEIWIGFAMKTYFSNGTYPLICIMNAGGIDATLAWSADSSYFYMTRGSFTDTVIGTGGYKLIGNNLWHFVELHYKIDPSAGIAELWIDNTQIFNNTSVNTTKFGNTSFGTFRFGGDDNNAAQAYYDDMYILDTTGSYNNTRLGDSRIQTLRPNSDAGPNDGTPSTAGPHYAMVNAPQNNGGATYITVAGTSDQEELFGMTSLSGTPTEVFAARVLNYAEKTDGGTLNSNAVIVSNSVVGNGETQNLLTNYSGMYGIFETDPSTGVAWTPAGINAADCGFKIA